LRSIMEMKCVMNEEFYEISQNIVILSGCLKLVTAYLLDGRQRTGSAAVKVLNSTVDS